MSGLFLIFLKVFDVPMSNVSWWWIVPIVVIDVFVAAARTLPD